MADEKNRRLLQNGDIIYPFTKQENVIGLQKTITDKLTIISKSAPTEFVERQAWLDISEDQNEVEEENENLTFENSPVVQINAVALGIFNPNEQLSFDSTNPTEELSFGEEQGNQEESNEQLSFGNFNPNEELSFEQIEENSQD